MFFTNYTLKTHWFKEHVTLLTSQRPETAFLVEPPTLLFVWRSLILFQFLCLSLDPQGSRTL